MDSNAAKAKKDFRKKVVWGQLALLIMIVFFSLIGMSGAFAQPEEEAVVEQAAQEESSVTMFRLVAAAVAFGLGAISSGIAIANIGAAAMGAIGEKPEIAGQALLFIAMADTLVIFGFITALLMLG